MNCWKIPRMIVLAVMLASVCSPAVASLAGEVSVFSPEWKIQDGGAVRNMASEDRNGRLVWKAALPAKGEKRFFATGEFQVSRADRLTFNISLPGDSGDTADTRYEILAYFKDVDYWWYQKLLPYVLRKGDSAEIVVSLDEDCDVSEFKYSWLPRGHLKPYSKTSLRKVREFGFVVFPLAEAGDEDAESDERHVDDPSAAGTFEVSDFQLVHETGGNPLAVCSLESPEKSGQYECFEATFRLSRTYENPFDPDEIDVSAVFTGPSGKKQQVYGFWFQDYIRTPQGRCEELTPVGDPVWKVRFTPSEVGEYSYTITAKDKTGSVSSGQFRFNVRQTRNDGFVRVSEKDYRYFEFDSGKFYWPITLNLHCTYDYRYVKTVRDEEIPLEDRRTYYYDDRFEKMARAGMNGTEIWIASWGFEIEWRGDWMEWAGLGHYSLQNAWRLDHVLDRAEDLGIYINLVMSCHGAYCYGKNNTTGDSEWQNSPFFTGNGGWIAAANVKTMFTDEKVFKAIQNRARYIVARYSHSPSIWCYEIISESDLVPVRKSNVQRAFILKYAQYIEDIDPYGHLLTNHYCGSHSNYDPLIFNNPVMDVASGDLYRGGASANTVRYSSFPKMVIQAAEHLAQFKKPSVINECGGTWSAGPACLLDADVHALNWATFMTHMGGTPQTWWEDFVDENYLYDHYAAFAKYQEGEDKRSRNLETHDDEVCQRNGKAIHQVFSLSLRNSDAAYAWIYDDLEFSYGPVDMRPTNNIHHDVFNLPKYNPTRTISGAICTYDGFKPGKYSIEIWDTYEGKVIDSGEIETSDGTIKVGLPDFSKDIALKIKSVLY